MFKLTTAAAEQVLKAAKEAGTEGMALRLAATQQAEAQSGTDILRHSVDELELSGRSRRCLDTLDVKTIGDLVAKTKEELMTARNFGRTSLKEVREKLAAHGLVLEGEEPGKEEETD